MREQQIAVAVVVGDSLFCEPRLCGKSIVMHTHTHTRTNNKKSILGSKGLEAERPVGELGDISLSLWGDWTSHGKGASKLLAAGATGGSRCARGLLLGLLEQVACKVRLLNVVFNVVHRRGVLWTQVEPDHALLLARDGGRHDVECGILSLMAQIKVKGEARGFCRCQLSLSGKGNAATTTTKNQPISKLSRTVQASKQASKNTGG